MGGTEFAATRKKILGEAHSVHNWYIVGFWVPFLGWRTKLMNFLMLLHLSGKKVSQKNKKSSRIAWVWAVQKTPFWEGPPAAGDYPSSD